ncbi:MAG: dihydrofolate reductase [Patescibacteria group bacterium]
MNDLKISIIVAMDEKRGIGKDNKIPWHIKEDLVKLKNLTKDRVVILGRITYDSMVWYYNKSGNPMPGKLYIVVTHDKNYKPVRDNSVAVNSLEDALEIAKEKQGHSFVIASEVPLSGAKRSNLKSMGLPRRYAPRNDNNKEIFIIGGGQIFQQALPLADKLYLTIVEGDFGCDTFFPSFSEFKKVISEESKESDGHKYKFLELEK